MQYLYLIKCQNYYKIGVANDIESRLAQLSTGNPFELQVEAFYKFDNAEIVERVLHQKLKSSRVRGEWFELSYDDITELHKLCLMLGGSSFEYSGGNPDDEAIEEAETINESVDGTKWDYAAMFADGWRMEVMNKDGSPRNWAWRRGSGASRETIYGGSINSLPYSVLEMRSIYRAGTAKENKK